MCCLAGSASPDDPADFASAIAIAANDAIVQLP
jgi:hypothetical protein